MVSARRATLACVEIAVAVALVACGRTGTRSADAGAEHDSPSRLRDAGRDAAPDAARVPVECAPSEERCNGLDDDCDGAVDELPPDPCEAGGTRLCVAGRWSECPRRCEACIPGSERVCFLSYCTFWGVQTCAADGRAFGPCRERTAPGPCLPIARSERDSPALERCCVDGGWCCVDRHDLDGDGDRTESLGDCEDVLCGP